jgi:hypothetical protein
VTAEFNALPDDVLHLHLKQEGSFTASTAFPLRIPVKIKWAEADTLVYIWLDDNEIDYWIQLKHTSTDSPQITLDPDKDLLARYTLQEGSFSPAPMQFTVFPNPVIKSISLHANLNYGIPNDFQLYTISGQRIALLEPIIENNGVIMLNPSIQISNGIYFLKFRQQEQQFTFRLMLLQE